jgi:hypothetical protein
MQRARANEALALARESTIPAIQTWKTGDWESEFLNSAGYDEDERLLSCYHSVLCKSA